MACICGHCVSYEEPKPALLHRAKMDECKIGWCKDIEKLVWYEDTPMFHRCEELLEDMA